MSVLDTTTGVLDTTMRVLDTAAGVLDTLMRVLYAHATVEHAMGGWRVWASASERRGNCLTCLKIFCLEATTESGLGYFRCDSYLR